MRTRSSRAAAAVAAVTAALVSTTVLSSCSGDSSGGTQEKSPEVALATAKKALDDTSGVHLELRTDDLPPGVTGVERAEGIGTHDPAFDGTITVVLSGQPFDVPVVSVDDKVYVQLPLTPGWQDIDPGDYGAPDPARLMSPDQGFSALLPATTGLEQGDSVRGGTNNSEILTEYTGTVSGDVVKNVIPTATGDFDATYTLSDDGQLREAALTGDFYKNAGSMTYTVTFDDYGTQKDISAP